MGTYTINVENLYLQKYTEVKAQLKLKPEHEMLKMRMRKKCEVSNYEIFNSCTCCFIFAVYSLVGYNLYARM